MTTIIYDENRESEEESIDFPDYNDDWNLRIQIEKLKDFVMKNESIFKGKNWICDIGFSFKENNGIVVYGSVMDKEFFELMLKNRITIFLSQYPSINNE